MSENNAQMEWLEVSVQVVPEAAEAVAEVLTRYAPQGVAFDMGEGNSMDTLVVIAYLAVDEQIEERRRKVQESLWHLSHIWPVIPDPVFRFIPDRDWSANWKERIPTLHIGRRVVIKPSWRAYETIGEDVVLEMDPGLAFGTGLHPTTQLCVVAVEDFLQPGMHVLDIGTGTGILSLAAAKLGAEKVMAVDTDENAVIVARRNARANAVANRIEIRKGSLADVQGRYDLVLANILAPVIIDMANAGLVQHLTPTGTLVASGILKEQADGVSEALNQAGLRVKEIREKDDWVALIVRHAHSDPPNTSRHRLA